MVDAKEKQIIRDLAKQYMEMASSDKQQRMNERMKATNDLKIVRPPVLIDEIPWYQINIDDELTCVCTSGKRIQKLETFLRRAIYRWKHFKADTLFEPFYRIKMAVDSTGIGIEKKEAIIRTDSTNNIVSHCYEDILEDESMLEKILLPTLTLRPDKDADNMEYFSELLGDVMPVKICGHGRIYANIWDQIANFRGIEPIMYDLYDRPEYMHALMDRFCKITETWMDFYEQKMHMDPTDPNLHCTPAMVSGLAEDGLKATWFRGTAQALTSVSPDMFKEFEIDHIKHLAERCAYTYYGCCEPLHDKMDVIKEIKNLRKIGVSPWADIESSAEQIGGDYVYARKPNPANVAIETDPAVIRKEIEDTVKACIKHGCPCEFVLKDISTVSHKPENLIVWAQTVSDVLDQYYDKA